MVAVPVWLCHAAAVVLRLFMKKPPIRRDLIIGVIMDANGSYQQAKDEIGYQPVNLYEKFKESLQENTGELVRS
jgi:hypothetical protein